MVKISHHLVILVLVLMQYVDNVNRLAWSNIHNPSNNKKFRMIPTFIQISV